MFNIFDDSVVYVLCPAFGQTGGVELAHQLVKEIGDNKVEVYITYYKSRFNRKSIQVQDCYKKYTDKFKTLAEVIDSEHNILIIPEIRPDLLNHFKRIQKSVWFMSVDNFITRNDLKTYYQSYGVIRLIKNLIAGQVKFNGFWKELGNNVTLFYQSQYALDYLHNHGLNDCYRLSDYINEVYLVENNLNTSNKENIVLYNPKKGYEFTKKIISRLSGYKCMPIENMTVVEVQQLLRRSKVYIDFGNHPGKDRFPREAAASACCVITGKRGSANYYEDVMIDSEFKYTDSDSDIPKIVEKIKQCVDNYESEICKFEQYRSYINKEHDLFKDDVRRYFVINNVQECR